MRFRYVIPFACTLLPLAGCGGDVRPAPTPMASAATSHSPSPTPTQDVRVDLTTLRNRYLPLGLEQHLEIAVVTGLADPAIERRINRLLREQPEQVFERWEDTLTDASWSPASGLPRTTRFRSEATIGVRGPRLLSVRYTFDANGAQLRRIPEITRVLITVDLTTGRRLSTGDLLSDRVRTTKGARALGRILAESGPHGRLCDADSPDVRMMRPSDFVSDDPKTATAQVFPDSHGVGFTLPLWKLGYPMSCSPQIIHVGYDKLDGFLSSRLSQR